MGRGRRQEPVADPFGDYRERLRGDRWWPDVDVYETEEAVVVRAELAGVKAEDLQVSLDGPLLRIRGQRRAFGAPGSQRLHQVEIATGPFERAIQIAQHFDADGVSAHLAEGYLTVTLAKRSPTARRVRLEVEGNG